MERGDGRGGGEGAVRWRRGRRGGRRGRGEVERGKEMVERGKERER